MTVECITATAAKMLRLSLQICDKRELREVKMKKAVIGGAFSLIGSIWSLAVMYIAGNNLVSGWSTPPGRFLTTVSEMGLMGLFVAAILLTVFGIAIMSIELFRKGD